MAAAGEVAAAIPHHVALFFLGLALLVVIVAAWFAILLSGRYPGASSATPRGSSAGTSSYDYAMTLVTDRLPTVPAGCLTRYPGPGQGWLVRRAAADWRQRSGTPFEGAAGQSSVCDGIMGRRSAAQ